MNSNNIIKAAAIADLIGHMRKQSYENPLFTGRATTPDPNEGAFNPNAAPKKFQEPIGFNAPKIDPNAGGFNPVKMNATKATPKPQPVRPAPNKPTVTPNPQPARPQSQAPRPQPARPQAPSTPAVPVNNPLQTSSDGSILSDSAPGPGYTLVGYSGGKKKWRQSAQAPQTTQPMQQRQTPQAQPAVPFKTRFDINTGTVVPVQGTPNAEYNNYMAAQQRASNFEGSDEQYNADVQTVRNYVGSDALNRTPEQIQEQQMEERAGLTQAGRYVGPPRYSAAYYAALNRGRR